MRTAVLLRMKLDQMLTPSNKALVEDLLDLMENDSENLERTMEMLTPDCTWVIEPGMTEYHGTEELRSFVGLAMSGREHDETHKIEVVNCFADNENICVVHSQRKNHREDDGGNKSESQAGGGKILHHLSH